jgi:ADP-ribose pyrophosphatase YjhB (NUDIX family)
MEATHAGGMVFRVLGMVAEYLLVGPSNENVDEWLLPKGHIKEGETAEQAALREVQEETGVTARIISPLDTIEFKLGDKIIRVNFFLMKFLSQVEPLEKRRHAWFRFEDAIGRATHAETKALLQKAAKLIAANAEAAVD